MMLFSRLQVDHCETRENTMGIIRIIGKELVSVKENIPFNLATIISPLLFLLAFVVMVSGGITIPVETQPASSESAFLQITANYVAPDGTPYLDLETAPAEGTPDGRSADRFIVKEEPSVSEKGATGTITHLVNDVNSNMTKNYTNRLTGALVNYINENRKANTVEVIEETRYEIDIPWDESFAVSTLVFGAMLAGLLFGQLSMTSEWENTTIKLLILSPCSAAKVVTGKVTGACIKAFVAGAVLVGVVALLYDRTLISALWLAVALCLMYVIFSSLGFALGIAVRSTMTAFLLSLVISLCLWVAGGGFGDLSYFGDAAQIVGSANPATYALDAIRYAYFGGVANPAPLITLAVGAAATVTVVCMLYICWLKSERAAS